MLLKFINNQTEDICLLAINNNVQSYVYVKIMTVNIALAIVKQDGMLLNKINNGSFFYWHTTFGSIAVVSIGLSSRPTSDGIL